MMDVKMRLMFCFVLLQLAEVAAVNLEDSCSDELSIRDASQLTVSNWTLLHERRPCTVSLASAPTSQEGQVDRLFVSLLDLRIPGGSAGCLDARLDILDSDGKTRLTPSSGLCGTPAAQQFLSTYQKVVLVLTANMTSDDFRFRMLVVRFHHQPCYQSSEFGCDNGRCIASHLQCNGDNNCGDNSDETDGCLTSTTAITIIGATTAGLILALVVVSVAAVRRRSSRETRWGGPPLMAGAGTINDGSPTPTRKLREGSGHTYGTSSE